MILLPLFYLLVSVRQWGYRRGYVIKAKEGNSIISEGAILKCLSSAVRTIPSVMNVKPHIKNEHGGLGVRIDALIKVEEYVPQIYQRIRERARSTLTGVLGIERITRIDVNIDRVRLPHPPLAGRIKKREKSPQPKPISSAISPKSVSVAPTRKSSVLTPDVSPSAKPISEKPSIFFANLKEKGQSPSPTKSVPEKPAHKSEQKPDLNPPTSHLSNPPHGSQGK